jgi:hypothetical protein
MRETIEYKPQPVKLSVSSALAVILDNVDYMSGACRPNEQIAAVLSYVLIKSARNALKDGCECERSLAAESENDKMRDSLQKIYNWSQAYPLDIFPEPDMKKVAEVLAAAGIELGSVSAYCMRHVISGVESLAKEGLGE